jgi:acetyl esterase/lipase
MSSFMSKFAAFAIRASGRKRLYADELKRKKYIDKLTVRNAKPFKAPPFLYRSKLEKQEFEGVEVFTFNKGREKKIIYLHGGAFCEPPLLPHFMFCDRVANNTDYEIWLPVYPKAPAHTFEESFMLLDKLYREFIKDTAPESIVLAGDSSGGGLVLSFCQYLKSVSLPQPKQMLLLSPWLDVSMDTPFSDEVNKVDPNLQYDFLKTADKNWAGDADLHDWRVSPIYGDLTELAPITVYYGTHENLIIDARLFRDKCLAAGARLDYREWEGMNHVFVIYPIPEADKAQKEIIELLR